ncbi:MAG: mechanosensitive ion channel family protein [Paracoccaceae bacterium]
MKRLFATVFAGLLTMASLVIIPHSGHAQDSQPSANDLQELSRLLSDSRIQEWLKSQTADITTSEPTEKQPVRAQLETVVQATGERVQALGVAWSRIGDVPELIRVHWREQLSAAMQVRSLTFILIFLFFGAGLEWLLRQYTNPVRKRLEITKYYSAAERIKAALYRTSLAFLGLFIFALGSIGAFSALSWPPLLNALILNALIVIVVTRATGTVLLLFLAPRVEQLRLVPVSSATAKVIWRVLTCSVAVFLICVGIVDLFDQLFANTADGARPPEVLAVAVLSSLLLLVIALFGTAIMFNTIQRYDIALTAKARRNWQTYLTGLNIAIFVLWLLELIPLVWTVALLGLLYPALNLLTAWVNSAFNRATQEFHIKHAPKNHLANDEDENVKDISDDVEDDDIAPAEDVIEPYEAYRPIAVRVARFALIVCVGLSLAVVWNVGIFERSDQPSLAQQVFSVLLDSAVALLVADLVWTWGRTAIDRRLAAYTPPEDGTAPGPEARMATLLPLLRVVLQITLLSIVIMSILAASGVNIAPILAGASVMGIAIGFGAQSLVKDVVSGIFFLVDDAFRIGEYVEIENLRGTVEKISIRSLQLRHHRGAVHTLPFGELKSLTNHSRDWVIMKLEFRVPFETDLKLVKKLVKQVGANLQANPDYGDSIIQTLKSQGVRRMEEFNMVVGVKFMTRPGEQWLVRRDAYQGVRDIFEANGIRMAERNVKVEIAGDENISDETKHAASAAAQEAIGQQVKPGPIPDEP